MSGALAQVLPALEGGVAGSAILGCLLYLLAGLVPTVLVAYAIHFLLTLPLRRKERARLFLDLLEMGLREGRTPEQAVMEAAGSRDRSLGARFHLLAAHLQQGRRLGQALDDVPRLLPPGMVGMLKAGERIGDVTKVLPACRKQAQDAGSQVRGALNYLLLLVFAFSPAMLAFPAFFRIKILPIFGELSHDMYAGSELPAFTRFVFGVYPWFTLAQALCLALMWAAVVAYVGGPRLHAWLRRIAPALTDWVASGFPWRRRRLERDFSAMLAVLLDGGVAEKEAVSLAAESTGNYQLQARARQAAGLIERGVPLPEALRAIESSGEFHWRMTNALRRGSGFLRALAGWHEALDAKAFQQEQVSAQVATTALVLFNGVVVASIVLAVFLVLISLLNFAL